MEYSEKNNWLFVLPTDSIQGSEHIVKNLATYVSGQGHACEVIILTKKSKKGWEDLNHKMQIKYLPFSFYGLGLCFLLPYLMISKTRHIHFTFSSQTLINGTLGLAKRLFLLHSKTKVVCRESNAIFELLKGVKLKIYTAFYKIGYKGSSLVICQTGYMQEALKSALPSLTNNLNIHTLSNPVDLDDIKIKSKATISDLENRDFIVAAGRLTHVKGFDILIEAFNQIKSFNDNLELIILGEGKDRSQLENLSKSLGISERVHLAGYVTNVYPYFKKAQCCVLSSRLEGFPNVLLQMMSQNTSVVATLSAGDIDTIPGLFICPIENVAILRDRIKESISTDNSQNRKIFDKFLESRSQACFYNKILQLTK